MGLKKEGNHASDKELEEVLKSLDWDKLWVMLIARADKIRRLRYTIRETKEDREDICRQIVSEVLEKIFVTKTRRWNITHYPDFKDFAFGVIDSHINNRLNTEKDEVASSDDKSYENIPEQHLDLDSKIDDKDLRDYVFDQLAESGADDNQLLIFECLADGITKPEEIRKEINLSKSDFHNAWRSLKRKRKLLITKLKKYGYRK